MAVSCLRNGAVVRPKDFSAHVAMLSSMASPHLVALLGYCCEDAHKILVHELCINGSLHDRLHGTYRLTCHVESLFRLSPSAIGPPLLVPLARCLANVGRSIFLHFNEWWHGGFCDTLLLVPSE